MSENFDFKRGQSETSTTVDEILPDHTGGIQLAENHGSLEQDLAQYFALETQDFSTAYDSALSNDGDITGSTWYGGDIDAFTFDGVDDEIFAGLPVNPSEDDPYTVCLWAKFPPVQTDTRFVSFLDPGSSSIIYLRVKNDQTIDLEADLGQSEIATSTSYEEGIWTHLAFNYNGSEARLYKNGVEQGSLQFSHQQSAEELHIGSGGGFDYTALTVADFRVYDRSLSAPELRTLYSLGSLDFPTYEDIPSASDTQLAFKTYEDIPPVDETDLSRPTYADDKTDIQNEYLLNGDATDNQGNNNGSATSVSFVDGFRGQAGDFDGTNSFINLGDLGIDDQANTSFSISTVVKADSFSGNDRIVTKYDGADADAGLVILKQNGGTWSFEVRDSGGTQHQANGGSSTTDEWVHLVGVWEEGNETRLYVNGERVATNDASGAVLGDYTQDWAIGTDIPTGFANERWDGLIDDVRIYTDALTDSQASNIYNFLSLDAAEENLANYYPLDGDVLDAEGANDGTNNGVTFDDAVVNQGGVFGGSDYIEIPDRTTPSSITISLWWMPLGGGGENQSLVDGGFDGSTNEFSVFFDESISSLKFTTFNGTNDTGIEGSDSVEIRKGEMYHIVATYDNNLGEYRFYLDGEFQSSFSSAEGPSDNDNTENWAIGAQISSGSPQRFASGIIDEVKIIDDYVGDLEARELYEQDYEGYQDGRPQEDNLQNEYLFDGDVTDEIQNNNATNLGASFDFGVRGKAAVFNRSQQDKIDLGDLQLDGRADTSFSFSFFLYLNSTNLSTSQRLVSKFSGSGSDNGSFIIDEFSGNLRFIIFAGGSSNTISTSATSGEWAHYAFTFDDSGVFKIYENGEEVASGDVGQSLPTLDLDVSLGGDPIEGSSAEYLDGRLDDFRVYNDTLTESEINQIIDFLSFEGVEQYKYREYNLDGDVTEASGVNDGTNNGVTFADGVRGQEGVFDGSSYVELPDGSPYTSTVISCFVKIENDTGTLQHIVDGGFDGSSTEFQLFYNDSTGTLGWTTFDGSTHGITSSENVNYNIGERVHLIAVYDDVDQEYRLYVNGDLKATVSDATGPGGANNTENWAIGAQISSGTPQRYVDGRIDEVKFIDDNITDLEAEELFQQDVQRLEATQEPGLQNLEHEYNFDGDFFDEVGTADGENNGASLVEGFRGQAASFNGDSVKVQEGLETFDTGFTVSAVVNADTLSGDSRSIAEEYDAGADNREWRLWFRDSSPTAWAFTISSDGANITNVYSDTAPETDEWVHLTGVWNGEQMLLYVNGELEASADQADLFDGDSPFAIGNGSTFSSPWVGDIDDVRIYSDALKPAEVEQLHEFLADDANEEDIIHYYDMEGDANDEAGTRDLTVNGATLTDGEIGQAYSFDGDDDVLEGPLQAAEYSGQDPFTFSFWLYWDGDTSTIQGVFQSPSIPGSSPGNPPYGAFVRTVQNNELAFVIQDSGNNNNDLDSTNPVEPNVWEHWILVRDPDAGELRLYRNGQLDNTLNFTNDVFDVNSPTRPFLIGGWKIQDGRYLSGDVDEFKQISRALSDMEAQELYLQDVEQLQSLEQSGFTSSEDPRDGLVREFKLDGDATESIDGASTTIEGGLEFVDGLYNQAGDFDGTDDRVIFDRFKEGFPKTFAVWIRPDSFGNFPGIIRDDFNDGQNYSGIHLQLNSGGLYSIQIGDGGGTDTGNRKSFNSATTLETGKWYFIVGVVRGIDDVELYLNSKADNGSTSGGASSVSYVSGSEGVLGFRDTDDQYFDGLIDEARIYTKALSPSEIETLYHLGRRRIDRRYTL